MWLSVIATDVVRSRGSPAASAPFTFDAARADVRDLVADDAHAAAALADLDRVAAEPEEPAVLDRHVPGAPQDQRARCRPRGLHGGLGRRDGGVLEGEAFEAQALHETLLLRLALEPQQGRQHGHLDRRRLRPLAGPRRVVEPSLRAIEVPLAGSERLEDVLDPVARVGVARLVHEGHERLATGADEARGRVEAREQEPLLDPEVEDDGLDVGEVPPGLDGAGGGHEGVAPVEEGLPVVAAEGSAGHRLDPPVALLREARPRPALAVHEQRAKGAVGSHQGGNLGRPDRHAVPGLDTPAGNRDGPAQDGCLAGRGRPEDRPGVLGREDQRLGEPVPPAVEAYLDRGGKAGPPLALAERVARPLWRRKGAVRASSISNTLLRRQPYCSAICSTSSSSPAARRRRSCRGGFGR